MTFIARFAFILPWAVLASSPAAIAQVSFRTLGDLPGGYHISRGFAISADGRIVGGLASPVSGAFATVWIDGGPPISVQPEKMEAVLGMIEQSSPSGEHLVGHVRNPYHWHWLHPKRLPTATPGGAGGNATAVSDDGRIIYGDTYGPGEGAIRWIDGVPENLTHVFPGDARLTSFWSCSGDGSVVGGSGIHHATGAWGPVIVRNKQVRHLGFLDGVVGDGTAPILSSDGLVAAGGASSPRAFSFYYEAFVWTEATGMIGLGDLPGGRFQSSAIAISRDGRVVGGVAFTDGWPGQHTGFVWDAVRGMRNVNTILDEAGINRDGWFIFEVNALSNDGSAMTGTARHLVDGRREAYLVRLPPPCWADCTGDDAVDFNDLLCFLNRFARAQEPQTWPVDHLYCDLARDNVVDFNDLLAFLNLYHAGCPR